MNKLNNRTRSKAIGYVGARLLVAALMVFLAAELPAAQARESSQIRQITPASDAFDSSSPSIDAAGVRIAFASNSDLTGENPDHNGEIFLFDAAANRFSQITHSTEGQNIGPRISANGKRVAFEANGELAGDDPNRNWEVFLFDTETARFTPITPSTECDSFALAINANGRHVALTSDCDLPGGNPGGFEEIFLYDTSTGQITQISSMPGESYGGRAAINADGTRVAYFLTEVLGDDGGVAGKIFLFDTTTGQRTAITPVVYARGITLSMNAAGTRVVFNAWKDLTGKNADGNSEIFLVNTTTHKLTQLTGTAGIQNRGPSMSRNGAYVAFYSESEDWDEPYVEPELFVVNTATRRVTQITDAAQGYSERPSVNADGSRIAFVSTSDLTGDNPGWREQIFLAEFEEPSYVDLSYFRARARQSSVVLVWKTSHEVGIRGYNLWRRKGVSGQYVKINTRLIPARGAAGEEATYRYVDQTGLRTKRYYYKLQAVGDDGSRILFGPLVAPPSAAP